ncbi:MAG TPA: PIN domain-containing protein [Tepidisphaeraceae bacterium]
MTFPPPEVPKYVLIDTSAWTHALRRKGDAAIRAKVDAEMAAERAAWCQIIRLELYRGANNDWDLELLSFLEANVKPLAISADVWDMAIHINRELRSDGITLPVPDTVIHACGMVHNARIQHNDKHFDLLQTRFPIY